jgi:DNA repair protein RecO (recombination protein O)
MPRLVYKTTAIVLRSLAYGESDLIMTFFSRDYGKLKGIAKGARRSKKRFVNALDLFSLSEIVFSRKGSADGGLSDGLALIESCDVREHYPGIRTDLERTLVATYVLDLVDQFSAEGKENASLFRDLEDFLALISGRDYSEALIRIFELRLLKFVGYGPVLDRCIRCGKTVDNMVSPSFSAREGGIHCDGCSKPDMIPVSCGTLKILMLGRDIEMSRIRRLMLSGRAATEGRTILTYFIRQLLGKELNSLRVLNDIKRMTS